MTDLHRQQEHQHTDASGNKHSHYYVEQGGPGGFVPDQGQRAGVGTEVLHRARQEGVADISTTSQPASQLPQQYTDAAQLIDQCYVEAHRESEEFAKHRQTDEQYIAEKEKELSQIEAEAQKRAAELARNVKKERRVELKEQCKLEEQERKTMQLAQGLANRQQVARKSEEAKRHLAELRRIQANQLAEQIAVKKEQIRILNEQRAAQLLTGEEAAKQRANELAAHQAQSVEEIEIRKRELRVSETVAKQNAEELTRLQAQGQRELEEMNEQMEKLGAEARMSEQLYDKHAQERAELERKAWELGVAEEQERERADVLRQARGFNEAAVANQQHVLAENEAKLHGAEFLVKKQSEERKTIEAASKKWLENEQEALEKARKLVVEQQAMRKQAQKDVAELTAEEQEARRRAFELERTYNVSPAAVGQEPVVLDVYQHKRYAVGQPQPELINASTHLEQGPDAQRPTSQQEQQSLVGKITDSIKNIF